MGSHSVTCHPTQVNVPRLNPIQTGWYSIHLPRRDERLSWQGWLVSRDCLQTVTHPLDRDPASKPTTSWSQVWRPTFKPPSHPVLCAKFWLHLSCCNLEQQKRRLAEVSVKTAQFRPAQEDDDHDDDDEHAQYDGDCRACYDGDWTVRQTVSCKQRTGKHHDHDHVVLVTEQTPRQCGLSYQYFLLQETSMQICGKCRSLHMAYLALCFLSWKTCVRLLISRPTVCIFRCISLFCVYIFRMFVCLSLSIFSLSYCLFDCCCHLAK